MKPGLKKIAIVGPESTGKTTLTNELSRRFGGTCVPEMARTYLEERGGLYSENDLKVIARLQLEAEDTAAEKASGMLICDTSLLVIRIWSEVRFGRCDAEISIEEELREYDLYLLPFPDLPWEPDPLREHPKGRESLFQLYYRALLRKSNPFAVITGSGEQRMRKAEVQVSQILGI